MIITSKWGHCVKAPGSIYSPRINSHLHKTINCQKKMNNLSSICWMIETTIASIPTQSSPPVKQTIWFTWTSRVWARLGHTTPFLIIMNFQPPYCFCNAQDKRNRSSSHLKDSLNSSTHSKLKVKISQTNKRFRNSIQISFSSHHLPKASMHIASIGGKKKILKTTTHITKHLKGA